MTSREVAGIAGAAGAAFASFYCFYSAAPLIFTGSRPPAGVRVAVVMVVVVLVQPFVLLAGRWLRVRARAVGVALAAMATGLLVLPLAGHWPGLALLGAGFGLFVLTSTAWAKEAAAAGGVGQALGIYGLGSAIGGAVGAPAGMLLATQAGLVGVVIGGAGLALLGLVPVALSRTRLGTNRASDAVVASARTRSLVRVRGAREAGGFTVISLSLAGHLLAVTLYAAVLSSSGFLVQEATATAAVLTAFAIQGAVALGRLLSGALCDRWSAPGTATGATILLVFGAAGFLAASAPAAAVVLGAVVGAASGAMQTAALTLMMRRASTPVGTERVSAAWNITFDIGLGAGALAAGALAAGAL